MKKKKGVFLKEKQRKNCSLKILGIEKSTGRVKKEG